MTLVETVYCDVSAATKLEGSLKMLGQCSKYEGFGQTTNEKMKSVSTAKTKSNDIAVWILNTTFVFQQEHLYFLESYPLKSFYRMAYLMRSIIWY